MTMDPHSPPVFRFSSYSPEDISSTSATSRCASTENPNTTTVAVASPSSSLSDKLFSTKKRQRALSEESDHAMKRHIPSSPCIGAQTNTKMNVSAPTSQTTRSTMQRDSGFHEDTPYTQDADDALDKRVAETSSEDDDSGFHDAVSDVGPDDDGPCTTPSNVRSEGPGQTALGPISAEDKALGAIQSTQTDYEYHDALDESEGDALTATSEMSIVVSSGGNDTSERSIVVSGPNPDKEQVIRVTQFKKTGSNSGDRDGAPIPNQGARVGRRDDALDKIQPSIVVSGPNPDKEKVIHVKSPKAARSEGHADPDQIDKEYAVSRIASHRLTAGADVELLVHWESPHDDGPTWVIEENLQVNALDAVVDYWATVFGGRLSVRPYEVFAVTGHQWLRKGRARTRSLHLEVEWLGYREKTMEPWRRFANDQQELVEEYFESIGGRPRKA